MVNAFYAFLKEAKLFEQHQKMKNKQDNLMKIVQVLATSGGVGGLEQHTFNLVNELSQQHEVHIIAHPCYADKFNAHVCFHAVDFL